MFHCCLSILIAATKPSGDEADGNKVPEETGTGKYSEFTECLPYRTERTCSN